MTELCHSVPFPDHSVIIQLTEWHWGIHPVIKCEIHVQWNRTGDRLRRSYFIKVVNRILSSVVRHLKTNYCMNGWEIWISTFPQNNICLLCCPREIRFFLRELIFIQYNIWLRFYMYYQFTKRMHYCIEHQ